MRRAAWSSGFAMGGAVKAALEQDWPGFALLVSIAIIGALIAVRIPSHTSNEEQTR